MTVWPAALLVWLVAIGIIGVLLRAGIGRLPRFRTHARAVAAACGEFAPPVRGIRGKRTYTAGSTSPVRQGGSGSGGPAGKATSLRRARASLSLLGGTRSVSPTTFCRLRTGRDRPRGDGAPGFSAREPSPSSTNIGGWPVSRPAGFGSLAAPPGKPISRASATPRELPWRRA
jgi:hypothetical protein